MAGTDDRLGASEPCDAIIVGGGLAGLTTALELIGQGQRVAILDRDTPSELGGLAKWSFGGIFFADTPAQKRNGVTDSAEKAYADWCRFGELGEGPDDAIPRAWAKAYCEDSRVWLHDWLQGMGQKFLPLPLWVERNGNSVPRWHVCWGTGDGLVKTILRAIDGHANRNNLSIHHGIRVERLLVEAGRVTGVAGAREGTGAAFELRAGRVVIAAGGINGSAELVRKYWHDDWSPAPPVILMGSHRYADGTMHRATEAAGGLVHRLDRNWHYAGGIHHWAPRKPGHGLSTVPSRTAMWVNGRGERIMPPMVSGYDTRDLVAKLCAQPAGYGWQIMNRKIALKELTVSGAEMNPAVRDNKKLRFIWQMLTGNRWLYNTLTRNCEDVIVADTLPDLVAKMNGLSLEGLTIDGDALEGTVRAYDAEIAKGPEAADDPQLAQVRELRRWRGDRLRLRTNVQILDSSAGPLVAIRTFPIARKSLGGIVTDLSSRVLTREDQPIPGLYAAGEAAGFGGGNMNGRRGLEGTFLGGALYSARRLGAAVKRGD